MKNYLVLTATLLLVGCNANDMFDSVDTPADQHVEEVSFSVGSDAISRTELEADGKSVRWSVGDEVSLWATGAESGTAVLSGDKFTLRYYTSTFDVAEFSAASADLPNISSMSDSEEYIYSAVYPYTENISGTQVGWTLPTSQSGEYDASLDLRVADEVTAAALNSDKCVQCDLSFESVVHQLRVTIPEGNNDLGEKISTLKLTLPYDCVGDISVDMGDIEAGAQITSGGSSSVFINLDTPVEAGGGEEFFVFIAPQSSVSGNIEFSAIGEKNTVSQIYSIDISGRSFLAGYYTEVGATILEQAPVTTLKFSVDHTKLGESVDKITITMPDGFSIVESADKGNVVTLELQDASSEITYDAAQNESLTGKVMTVVYESANAIVTSTHTFGTITKDVENSVALATPYLFEESFNSVTNFVINDSGSSGVPDTSNSDDEELTDHAATELSNYNLAGWHTGRGSGSTGNSVRVVSYDYQTVYMNFIGSETRSGSTYSGRLDSPKIGNIKDGSTVKVKVIFNYSGNRAKSGSNTGSVTYNYGWFKESSATATTENSSGSTISYSASNTSTTASNVVASAWKTISTMDGSFTSVGNTQSDLVIDYCNNLTRLSWFVYCSISEPSSSWMSTVTQYGHYWLYIDNVQVSISQ